MYLPLWSSYMNDTNTFQDGCYFQDGHYDCLENHYCFKVAWIPVIGMILGQITHFYD